MRSRSSRPTNHAQTHRIIASEGERATIPQAELTTPRPATHSPAVSSAIRRIPAEDFYLGPYSTVLEPDELVIAIQFPDWPISAIKIFREVAQRPGDFALVGLVGALAVTDGVVTRAGLAWFGMGPTPVKARQAETALVGQSHQRLVRHGRPQKVAESRGQFILTKLIDPRLRLLLLDAENHVNSAFADLSAAMGYREPHRFSLADELLKGPADNALGSLLSRPMNSSAAGHRFFRFFRADGCGAS